MVNNNSFFKKIIKFAYILLLVGVVSYAVLSMTVTIITYTLSEINTGDGGGITTNATTGTDANAGFWVVDKGLITMRRYNSSFTQMTSCADNSGTPYEIATNNTDYWILYSTKDSINHTTNTCTKIDNKNTNDFGCSEPAGIATNGSEFWVGCNDDDYVYNLNKNLIEYGLCYQESFNVSTNCGGLSTGSFQKNSPIELYDGSWSTHIHQQGFGQYYVNYTVPPKVKDVIWMVKTGQESGLGMRNAYCFNYGTGGWDELYEWTYSATSTQNLSLTNNYWNNTYIQCSIDASANAPAFAQIYEEAMYFNFTNDGFSLSSCNTSSNLNIGSVATNNTYIYVQNTVTGNNINEICIFDKNGNWVDDFNLRQTGIELNDANGITISGDGKTYWVAYDGASREMVAKIAEDTYPPVIQAIKNKTITYKDFFYYDINVTEGAMQGWTLDDNTNFTIESNGSITNKTKFSIVNYTVNITATDTTGNKDSRVMILNVTDPYPPVIICPSNKVFEVNETGFSLDCNGTDYSTMNEWRFNGTSVSSIDSNGIITNTTHLKLGIHSFNVTINDTHGNENSTLISLNISDSVAPLINWSTLTKQNNTNTSNNFIDSNVTFTEKNFKNITWYFNGVKSAEYTTITESYNKTSLADGNYSYYAIICDIAGNCNQTETRLTVIDTIHPRINFNGTTDANNTNKSNNWISSSVNITELHLLNITWKIDGFKITYNTLTETYNYTGLSDGTYYYNVTACDFVGNCNSTETRVTRIDVAGVSISIINPSDYQTFTYQTDIPVNYTALDAVLPLDDCWWTNSSGAYNYTITCGQNFTVSEAGDGDYIIQIYANNTLGETKNESVHYSISLTSPAVTINKPSNNQWLNNGTNISFNVTGEDANGLQNMTFWGNWSGWHQNATNKTAIYSGNSTEFLGNLSEGSYLFNFLVYDSTDTSSWSSINFTFHVDETKPIVGGLSVAGSTGSQTISFNQTITEQNLGNCYFSIYNANWTIDGLYNNISLACDATNTGATVSDYGTYTLRIYSNDLAGNSNYSQISFNVSATSPIIIVQTPTQQGGASPTTSKTSVLEKAKNFTIRAGLSDKLDFVLAKGTVKPRTKYISILNYGVEPITVNLSCDTTSLSSNESTEEGKLINICDYVQFTETKIVVSPNELEGAETTMTLLTPENSTFGDLYNFNILAKRTITESDTEEIIQYSKLSVSSRVPLWGLVFKWSYFPLQNKDLMESEKSSYPVAPISLLIAFLIFTIIFLIFQKKMALTGFSLGVALFFISFGLLLFLL